MTYYTYWYWTDTNNPRPSGYDYRFMFVVSSTQNVSANTSTVTVEQYIIRKDVQFSNTYYTTGTVAGVDINRSKTLSASGSGQSTSLIGSGSTTVSHNSDGTKTISFSGAGRGSNGGTMYTGSKSITLPTIHRYTSITSYTRTNITLTSFRVNWKSANTVDRVEYRINGGSWTLGQSGDRTSGNFTVSGRSPNTTYQVQIRVRRKDSGLWTSSENVNVKTTDIARITSAPNNIPMGDDITVNYSNPSGSSMEISIFKTNDAYNSLVAYRSCSGSSYKFVLTETEKNNLYNTIPNSPEINLRIYLKTISGSSSWLSSVDRKFIITNANPIFSNFEYEDINPDTLDLTGDNQTIIKGYSNLKATITSANKMEAIKGANPKEYQLVVGSKQIKKNYHETEDVELTLNAIENNVFIVYAIDSRGNSTQKQISPSTYIDYFKPTISEVKVSRQNNISTLTNLNFSGTFFYDNFGAENNVLIATYQYRKTTSEEWIDGNTELTLTINDNNFSFDGLIAGDLNAEGFTMLESFEIRVKVEDMLTDESRVETLVSAKPNIALHKDGTAIGGMYDTGLDKGIQLYGDNIYVNGIPLIEWEEI